MRLLLFCIFIFLSKVQASSIKLARDLETIRANYSLPSLSAAYIKSNEVIEIASTGVRKVGDKETTTINDKFHLGSCAKSMTATLAALLSEKKLLAWDNTLDELLKGMDIHPQYQKVTFELLLAHRAGLPSRLSDEDMRWLHLINEEGLLSSTQARYLIIKKVLSSPPAFEPIERFEYSNMGYIIAGYIMEKLTSKDWQSLVETNLFKPLGMTSCGFGPASDPKNKKPKQPWGHYEKDGVLIPIHADNPPAFEPAGGIHCSLQDWGKYLMMHIDGFNSKSNFLTQSSFHKLHSTFPKPDSDYTYGGWIKLSRTWAKAHVLHHTGSNTLNYANVWLAPALETIFISTTNAARNGHEATSDAVMNMLDRNIQ